MKKLSLLALFIGIALAGAWFVGFLSFVDAVVFLREPGIGPDLVPAEAIVVLTGGSERMATGIELLKSGHGKKLFISGVHKKLSLENTFRSLSVPQDLQACCITLGYQANSTEGNVAETLDWLRSEGFTSLRLVTANYHMPRSLLLFRAAMPELTIVPFPVAPEKVKVHEWEKYPGTGQLLVTEYCKYLIARLKLGMRP